MDFRDGPTLCEDEHGTVLIKVRQFRDVSVHKPKAEPSGLIEYDVSAYDLNEDYAVKVYPNGCDSSTEGQVCLEFEYVHGLTPYLIHKWTISHFELECTIAVVDVEGKRRFCKSYGYVFDPTQGKLPKFLFDNFVSRRFLLASADELLPDDTLTLQVDVVVTEHHAQGRFKDISFFEWVTGSCEREKDEKGRDYTHLPLDSDVVKFLSKESPYVECLNKYSTRLTMLSDDCCNFGLMMSILWCLNDQDITLRFSFQEILEVYALADFYMIESVLDTCRRWLELVCHTCGESLSICMLDYWYSNEELRKIAEQDFKKIGIETSEKWTYKHVPSEDGSIIYRFECSKRERGYKRHESFTNLVLESIKTERRTSFYESLLHIFSKLKSYVWGLKPETPTAFLEGGGGEQRLHHLLLGSPLAERLQKESAYFKSEFAKAGTNYVNIPDKQFDTLVAIASIMFHRDFEVTLQFTFGQIIEVYALASVYDIESVVDTCRHWLRLLYSTKEYELRNMAEKSSKRGTVGEELAGLHPRKQDRRWTCNIEEYPNCETCFLFKLRRHTGDIKREIPEDVSEMSNCYL